MTNDGRATFPIIGTLRSIDGKGVVRMEGRYDTDIDDLWSAISEPRRLARWIAKVDGDLHVGGACKATFTSSWEGPGRVDVCEPPHRLLVTMSPGQEDETVIAAELASHGDQTVLVVEERGLPLEALAAHGAGWHAHVEDLADHVARRAPRDWRSRWMELSPSYRSMTVDSD